MTRAPPFRFVGGIGEEWNSEEAIRRQQGRGRVTYRRRMFRAFMLFLFSRPLENRKDGRNISLIYPLRPILLIIRKGSKEYGNKPIILSEPLLFFYATGLFFLKPGTKRLNRSPEELGNQPTTKKRLLETKEGFSIQSYLSGTTANERNRRTLSMIH